MKKISKKLVNAIEYSIQNPTISLTKIGKIFKVDRHAISKYKANNEYLKYNIENQSNKEDEFLYYFTEKELHDINIYLNNPNTAYNDLNLSFERRSILRWLPIFNAQKTIGGSQKYNYNRNKFKEILTEEDAYWLGFITADGCIVENKWLQIQLAEKDKEHLKKFCSYMELTSKETEEIIKNSFGGAYSRDNPVVCVKICSVDIINNLKDKGIEPNKSGKEKPYKCFSKELEKAYIRGLIDGDGYIRNTQYGIGIVGSYEICNYVKNFINDNIKDISNNHIHEHGIIWKLEISGKIQCSYILNKLYENANIFLDRKYQLYQENYK